MNSILCNYKEYRLINGKWHLEATSSYDVNESFVMGMVDSSAYFSRLGGYMYINYAFDKVVKIVSISICKTIKKVFYFSY